MTWEELKEEAKKLGYSDYDHPYLSAIEKDEFVFYKGGWIYFEKKDGNEVLFSSGRTYDQMLSIMEALR